MPLKHIPLNRIALNRIPLTNIPIRIPRFLSLPIFVNPTNRASAAMDLSTQMFYSYAIQKIANYCDF